MPVGITAYVGISGLGKNLAEHQKQIDAGKNCLQPLKNLYPENSNWNSVLASWLKLDSPLKNRKYTSLTEISLLVAQQTLEQAKISSKEKEKMALLVGSSRGNITGQKNHLHSKRPLKLMSASNSTHQEMMIAISVENKIKGHTQTLATGCSASLDALGWGYLLLKQGISKKALIIGAEMPLAPKILEDYFRSGMLSKNQNNNPYSQQTSGFFPAEGVSGIIIESQKNRKNQITIEGYWSNSDGAHPLASNTKGLSACLQEAKKELQINNAPPIRAICPHASATLNNYKAETQALQKIFSQEKPSLHLLKPFTGHTLGASGVLETSILCHYLKQNKLPRNFPSLSAPSFLQLPLPQESLSLQESGTFLKIASSMGGHNSIIALRYSN